MEPAALQHALILACLVCASVACLRALRSLARRARRQQAARARVCAGSRVASLPAAAPKSATAVGAGTCAAAASLCKLAKQTTSLRGKCTSTLAKLPSGAAVAVSVVGDLASPASSAPCSVADSFESHSSGSSGISSPSDSDTESNGGRRLSTGSTCSTGSSTCARRVRAAGTSACSAGVSAAAPAAAPTAMAASPAATCSDASATTADTTTASSGSCSSGCSSAPSPRPGLRSALRRPQAPRAKAGYGPAARKTVKFSAEGDTICTPPTLEALGLLAAGARPVPVVPTAASPSPSSLAAAECPTAAAVRSLSAELPAGLSSEPTTVGASSSAPLPGTLSPASSLSLTSASVPSFRTPGQQRVQQALAEAKARHAHLGLQPLPAAWPLPPHAPGYEAELRAEEAARQRLQQAQEPQAPGRWERLAGSPNLPLSHQDSGLLALAYRAAPAAPELPAGSAEVVAEVEQEQGQPRRQDLGRRAGGAAAAAALREMMASEPLLLARVVARQQALSRALVG
ncbi:hypothetical protein HXX76_007257 [Chlamydomonas incerta]|uniref:Uncharacterized protein n=1 Tax=Chlamydomonas incerta TaxID=51695 RepID=A0A835SXY3_CHLIN|nr:hypothetical protein HXX76_007257 [Chlamydomonas incerta]|eukprot:KAG2435173.1 hypothetical protein HXX76_007257 [Chlamydomonas incerta]